MAQPTLTGAASSEPKVSVELDEELLAEFDTDDASSLDTVPDIPDLAFSFPASEQSTMLESTPTLDDLSDVAEDSAGADRTTPNRLADGDESSAGPEERLSEALQAHRKVARNKLPLLVTSAAVLLAGFGYGCWKWVQVTRVEHPPTRVIRSAIPLKYVREPFELLVLTRHDQKTDLVLMSLELEMPEPIAGSRLSKDGVTIRDLIYQFLQDRGLQGDLPKDWQSTLPNQIMCHLSSVLPHSGVRAIHVNHLQRL